MILSTQTNSGGAGVPRNVGIKHASGKYLTFVDNDDMLLPTALGDFFDAAEKFQADVVHTVKAFVYEDADGKNFTRADLQLQSDSSDDGSNTPRLETKNLRKRMTDYVAEKYFWLPWGKFYRRDFLLENEIDFPQTKFSEDMVFLLQVFMPGEELSARAVRDEHSPNTLQFVVKEFYRRASFD